jgi:hypothetical protein
MLVALLAVPADVITVDDDGPADYATIVDAVAAAAPGDIVLVAPGSYAGFVLDKHVILLSATTGIRPLVTSSVLVTAAEGFTLAGFDLTALKVDGVTGSGLIDDCSVGLVLDEEQLSGVMIGACAQILISRSSLDGWDPDVPSAHGGSAVKVTDSQVAIVGCELAGADGSDATSETLFGGSGGEALSVSGSGSRAFLVASNLTGGNGGAGFGFTGGNDGNGGNAVVMDHAKGVLRAAGQNHVSGGWSLLGAQGKDIYLKGGKLVVSDVIYDPSDVRVDTPGQLLVPPLPEPFLTVTGSASIGGSADVLLYGPADQPGLLLSAVQPGNTSYAKLELPFWLAPDDLIVVPIVTAGVAQPLDISLHVPNDSNLVGVVVLVQGVFPSMASTLFTAKKVVTNPVALVIRP